MLDKVRVSICWALVASFWVALWLTLRGSLSDSVLLYGLPVLFVWSLLLPRAQRRLAWLCWVSIVGILLLALWLPVR